MKNLIPKIPEDKMLRVMLVIMAALFFFYLAFIAKFFENPADLGLNGQESAIYVLSNK